MLQTFRLLWGLWGLYLLVGIVWFAVVEIIASLNDIHGDTLSEVIRDLHVPAIVWFVGGGTLVGLVSWLVPHFIGKWNI